MTREKQLGEESYNKSLKRTLPTAGFRTGQKTAAGQLSNIKLTVRQATHDDIPQMCCLLAELFSLEADFTPDAEKQARGLALLLDDVSGLSAVFVAEEGDEIAGMCSVQALISTAEGGPVGLLEDLIVRKDLRRKGIGRSLLSELFRWCKNKNISRVQLLMDIENNRAEMFYDANDWSNTRLVCMRRFL